MLNAGNASQLAAMMLDSEKIFPAFIELLVNTTMFVRLGAMVVMEEIADQNPEIAAQVIEPLWKRFHGVADQVKGDILYVFGELSAAKSVPMLKAVINGAYSEEVKEAAREALEKIEMA